MRVTRRGMGGYLMRRRVSEVNWGGSGLTGSMPAQISELAALITLALTNNHLNGQLPPELGR